MAKVNLSNCDKMVRRVLFNHGCQTSKQLRSFSNRIYNEDYSTGSISAALRKLVERGLAAHSENEKGQKVYWLTDFGKDLLIREFVNKEEN